MGLANSTMKSIPSASGCPIEQAAQLPRFVDFSRNEPIERWPAEQVRDWADALSPAQLQALNAPQMDKLEAEHLCKMSKEQLDVVLQFAHPELVHRIPVPRLLELDECALQFRFDDLSDAQRHAVQLKWPRFCVSGRTATTSHPGCLPNRAGRGQPHLIRLTQASQLAGYVKNSEQLAHFQRADVFPHYEWSVEEACGPARMYARSAGVRSGDPSACETYLHLGLASALGGTGTRLPSEARDTPRWRATRVTLSRAAPSGNSQNFGANLAGTDRVGRLPGNLNSAVTLQPGDIVSLVGNLEQRRNFLAAYPDYDWRLVADNIYGRPRGLNRPAWLQASLAPPSGDSATGTRLPERGAQHEVRANWRHGPLNGDQSRFANHRHSFGTNGVVKAIDESNRPTYLDGSRPAASYTRLLEREGIAIVGSDRVQMADMHACADIVRSVLSRNPGIARHLSETRFAIELSDEVPSQLPESYTPAPRRTRIFRPDGLGSEWRRPANPDPGPLMQWRAAGDFHPASNKAVIYGSQRRPWHPSHPLRGVSAGPDLPPAWRNAVQHELLRGIFHGLPPSIRNELRTRGYIPSVVARWEGFSDDPSIDPMVQQEEFAVGYSMWLHPDPRLEAERLGRSHAEIYDRLFGSARREEH